MSAQDARGTITGRITDSSGAPIPAATIEVSNLHNRAVTQFAFDQPNPIAAQAIANYAANPLPELAASQFKVMGGLLFAGTIRAGRQYWSGESGHIMPRIGLAYQLTPNPENSCTAALLGLS